MAAKSSISIPVTGVEQGRSMAQRAGFMPGSYAVNSEALEVDLDSIDALVTAHLRSSSTPPVVAPCQMQRIDRVVHLSLKDEITLTEIEAKHLAAITRATTPQAKQIAQQITIAARAALRHNIITPIAQGDVGHNTYFYGRPSDRLSGALPLLYPTGEHIECDSLIHLTHPLSPEDLALRERNIKARRIYRYRVLNLDDAEWGQQEEPLNLPMTPAEYRALLLRRYLRP